MHLGVLLSVQGGVFWASAPKGLRFVNRGYWGGLKSCAHSKIRNLQWVQRYDTGVIFCLEAHAFRCALRSVQGGVFWASAPKSLRFVNRGYWGGLKTSAHSKIRNLQWVQRYDTGVIFCLEAYAFRCALRSVQGLGWAVLWASSTLWWMLRATCATGKLCFRDRHR